MIYIGTIFDRIDLWKIVAVFAMGFIARGFEWRWIVTSCILAADLVLWRYSIQNISAPWEPMAIYHAGAAMALLAWSASKWGRSLGAMYLAMMALDGAVMAGLLDGTIRTGLHWNFWNYISTLQHLQAGTLFVLFVRHGARKWITL